jgi:hypothetical protein
MKDEGGRMKGVMRGMKQQMKDELFKTMNHSFILHPSAFILAF